MSAVSSSATALRQTFRPAVWLKRLFLAACLFVVVAVVWFAITQLFAARELSRFTDDLSRRGIPFDNASMATALEKKTHPEGSQLLSDILKLSYWGGSLASVESLPIIGGGLVDSPTLDQSIMRWKEWPKDAVPEQIVSDYLKEMEPMFVLLEQLDKMPMPVRLDLEIDGINTLLKPVQDASNVMRVLTLEARYAIFKKDKPRTFRAFQSMMTLQNAIDSRSFLGSEFSLISLQNVLLSTIHESMTFEFWNEEEVTRLRKIVEEQRARAFPWRETLEFERALALASLNSLDGDRFSFMMATAIPKLPSAKLKLMKFYDQLIEAHALPLEQKRRTIEEIERSQVSLAQIIDGYALIASLLMPSTSGMGEIVVRTEDHARLASIACSIRQFQIANNRWPVNLEELTTTGVPNELLSTVERGRFGYEVEDGKAWLWSYDFRDARGKVSAIRPTDQPTDYMFQLTIMFE
ncbi:MAG: hypothetical protein MUC83_13610 [Pirellula sp.]|nr:hypothetical protein [Pirellula sp.]